MGVIFCGVCGGRIFSCSQDDHTKRYGCARRRPGHQLTVVAQPVDDLVARRILELLTTPVFRRSIWTVRRRNPRASARGAGISAEPYADPLRRLLRARGHGQRRSRSRRKWCASSSSVFESCLHGGARIDPARVQLDIPLLDVVASAAPAR